MSNLESPKKSKFQFGFVSMGALLGVVLSCLYGPKVISWWFEPPVDVGYNCRPATDWAMKRLMLVQIASLLLGALLATGILKVFKKREE